MDFAAGVYLSRVWGIESHTPPPLLHTVYLFTQGREGAGGELNKREGVRGNSSQSWVENTNMTSKL